MIWRNQIKNFGLWQSTVLVVLLAVLITCLVALIFSLVSGVALPVLMWVGLALAPIITVGPIIYFTISMIFKLEQAELAVTRVEAENLSLRSRLSPAESKEHDQLISDLNSFAQTVAHDLKSPLTTILGFSSMLSDHQAQIPPEQQKEALQSIFKTALKMNNIIQELLLLAAVRQSDVKTRVLDMPKIVNEVKQRLSTFINESQAQVTMPAANAWPKVIGYGPWIEEVWINYVSNAIKYGGRPPVVEIGVDAHGFDNAVGRQMIRFWVRDNGKGISQEDQDRLFTQFTRLEQVRAEGHGLGLSIVLRIIEKLGGQVGVESEIGKGSLFYFTLPLEAQSPTIPRNLFKPRAKKETQN